MINPKKLCPGCMNEMLIEGKCPICGYDPAEPVNPVFLKPRSVLEGRYVVGKPIESNGEGVTYLGYDTVTSAIVNIREFFPTGLCERDTDGATVNMLTGSEFAYNDALLKFIELSKGLFRLNELPALFDVLDVREANGTAYRITRHIQGITLREFLMRNGGVLKWDQARSLFAPLIASVSALHKAGIIHRGISPDTLIVGKDGKLRLSGFCIAEARTAKSPLTSQLFPGFAAVEQYGDAGVQGTWTDVYSFAATVYRTLVGNPPPEATERLENDNMTIPAKVARETPIAVLETLANALQILPNDRTAVIDEMRKGMSVSSSQVPVSAPKTSAYVKAEQTAGQTNKDGVKHKKNNTGKMYGLVAGIVTVFLLAVILGVVLLTTGVIGSKDDSSASNETGNGLTSSLDVKTPTDKVTIEEENKKVQLPDFKNCAFNEAENDINYQGIFNFKIIRKEYSDTYSPGKIISQSPNPGTIVDPNTTVEVVVSLGTYYEKMPNVIGKMPNDAMFELLKEGFRYQNIVTEYKIDTTMPAGVVIESTPKNGDNVNIESRIVLVINSYEGEAPKETEPLPDTPTSSTSSIIKKFS